MATGFKVKDIESLMSSVFTQEEVNSLSRRYGFIKRSRKISAWAFVLTLVLGFSSERKRSISSLRRAYSSLTGTAVVPSTFYDRFSASLVRLLKELVKRALLAHREPSETLKGMWEDFADVVMMDATVFRLHDLLRPVFKGSGRGSLKAAAKLHVVMSAVGTGPRSVLITGETTHESRKLVVGPWVANRLLLFDLGYFRYGLFDRITHHGGYFISRVKKSSNPRIVKLHTPVRGRAIDVVGKRLLEVLPTLKRQILDVEVELEFSRRPRNGHRSQGRRQVRLVAVHNEDAGDYHLYFTNIGGQALTPRQIAMSYSCRWSIELLFREMKQHYRLSEMTSSNRHVVEALLYAAILTLVVSRTLWQALRKRFLQAKMYSTPERWATLLQSLAPEIAELMLHPRGQRNRFRRRLKMVIQEAPDVHLNRYGGLLSRVQFEGAL